MLAFQFFGVVLGAVRLLQACGLDFFPFVRSAEGLEPCRRMHCGKSTDVLAAHPVMGNASRPGRTGLLVMSPPSAALRLSASRSHHALEVV